MVGIRDALQDTLDDLEARYGDDSDLVGRAHRLHRGRQACSTGSSASNLIILAARPGMGKTSLALGMARNVATQTGRPVVFFSMEMGALELTKRLLAMEARRRRHPAVDRPSSPRPTGAGSATRSAGSAEAQLLHRRQPALHGDGDAGQGAPHRVPATATSALVVVDYIQLMTPSTTVARAENRQVEVSEISRGLKILARELECPVMALSQLNRQLEYRQDKRPMLADLRESGGLEQDADVVAFIYRDEVYNPESDDRGMAEIIIAKHRNGPTGNARARVPARARRVRQHGPRLTGRGPGTQRLRTTASSRAPSHRFARSRARLRRRAPVAACLLAAYRCDCWLSVLGALLCLTARRHLRARCVAWAELGKGRRVCWELGAG